MDNPQKIKINSRLASSVKSVVSPVAPRAALLHNIGSSDERSSSSRERVLRPRVRVLDVPRRTLLCGDAKSSTTTTTTMVSRHQRKKIISVRTNAVFFPMMTPVAMIGSIDTDRIANAYDFSSSTNQIEVQRVFEVAEQAPAMEAPAPAMEAPAMEMGMEAQDVPAVETATEMTVEQAPTVEAETRRRNRLYKKAGGLDQSRTP